MSIAEFRLLPFNKREEVIEELSSMVSISGANLFKGQYLQMYVKQGVNTNKVKSFLKKNFGINYRKETDYVQQPFERMFTEEENIKELCKLTLEVNLDLDYHNKYAPMHRKISEQVYRYGRAEIDWLCV